MSGLHCIVSGSTASEALSNELQMQIYLAYPELLLNLKRWEYDLIVCILVTVVDICSHHISPNR